MGPHCFPDKAGNNVYFSNFHVDFLVALFVIFLKKNARTKKQNVNFACPPQKQNKPKCKIKIVPIGQNRVEKNRGLCFVFARI